MLKHAIKLIGANRIALGSDYPFPLGEEIPGKMIESMNLDEKTRSQLFHEAALEWLNLPKKIFD